jgi:hypothetical protein
MNKLICKPSPELKVPLKGLGLLLAGEKPLPAGTADINIVRGFSSQARGF